MLITKIRTGIKTPWAKGLLFFFFVALFGGFGIANLVKRLVTGKTGNGFIVVNGREITRSTFEEKRREAQDMISRIYQRFGQSAPMIMAMQGINQNPEESARTAVIQGALLDGLVENLSIDLSQDYLDVKLQDPYFLVSQLSHIMPPDIYNQEGRINVEAFKRFLATQNLAPFEEELINNLSRELALKVVAGNAWLPDFVKENLLKSNFAQRKFTIASFSFESALKAEKEKGASPEEIKEFFDQQNEKHKRYYIPAKRNGVKWSFAPKDFDISVSDKEVENFYNKAKLSRFVDVPVQVKIREIVFDQVKEKGLKELKLEAEKIREQALADPSKFAELAEKHSSRKETAKNGGLVDFFKRGQKEKEIERFAFRLKKDGEISPIIPLKNGFALIQRVARKEATFKPLVKVKDEIVNLLKDKKFRNSFTAAANRVIKSNSQDEKAFKEFVEKYKGTEEKIPALAKGEGPVAARLFSLKKHGDKAAYISEGKGIIIELQDSLKKNLPPFEMLKPYVEEDLYKERARKSLAATLEKAKKQAFKDKKIAPQSGAEIDRTGWIDNSKTEELQKIFAQGVPQDILALEKQGAVLTAMGQNAGFLIQLEEIKPIDEEKQKEERNKISAELAVQFKNLFTGAFIASLNRTATIETNSRSDERNDIL